MKIDIIITVFSHSDELSWFCLGGTSLPAGIIIILLESAGLFSQPRHHTPGALYKRTQHCFFFFFIFFFQDKAVPCFSLCWKVLQTTSPSAITGVSSQLLVTLSPLEPDCSCGTARVSCVCLLREWHLNCRWRWCSCVTSSKVPCRFLSHPAYSRLSEVWFSLWLTTGQPRHKQLFFPSVCLNV